MQEKEYVGFATLPNQVHRKSVKKGFDFTLMVAGEPLEPVGQTVQQRKLTTTNNDNLTISTLVKLNF